MIADRLDGDKLLKTVFGAQNQGESRSGEAGKRRTRVARRRSRKIPRKGLAAVGWELP